MSTTTALITGASEGIGLEIARVLAAKGWGLVLVARRLERLEEVSSGLRSAYGVEVDVVAADLAESGAARRVHEAVAARGRPVDLLVNNAGLLTNGPFHETDLAPQSAMLSVNVVALSELTHVFLQDMVERGEGRILNVASVAAWVGLPEEAVYSASKAYVLAFSLAVDDEMRGRGTGVTVTALCPGYTATKMIDDPDQGGVIDIPRALVLDPAMVARAGVEGCLAGKRVVIPGASNAVAMQGVQFLPRAWATSVMGRWYRRRMSRT